MSKSQADLIDELIEAAENGKLDLLKKCLDKVRDGVNARNSQGCTSLHFAAQEGRENIVKYLLDNGATVDLTDDDGDTPLSLAQNNDHDDIVELLENASRIQNIVEWSLLGSSKLVHIEASVIFERKLIEIFNFESREQLTILEKLKTGAETILPSASFDTLPEETLQKVFQKFTQLGGVADESFVFHAKVRIKKNTVSSPLKPKQGD